MANIKVWLEEIEKEFGEEIEAIVVGQHDDRPTRFEENDAPMADENVILTREAGMHKLDEDYDNGFGGADCFPMYAWTKTRVFLMTEYDGSTGMSWVPRNPMNVAPEFNGQYQ